MGQKQSLQDDDQQLFLMMGSKGLSQQFLIFNPQNESFYELNIPADIQFRKFMASTIVDPEQIFYCGGINSTHNSISNELVQFNPCKGTFITKSPMIHQRYTHLLTHLNNQLYAIGGRFYGQDDNSILKSCECYDIKHNKWRLIGDLNKSRSTAMSMIYQNKIYVFGGYTNNKIRSRKIEVYDEELNIWKYLKFKLIYGVEQGCVGPYYDGFMIMGGQGQKGAVDTIQAINLENSTCEILGCFFNKARALQKGFQNGNQFYIFGGDKQNTCEKWNSITTEVAPEIFKPKGINMVFGVPGQEFFQEIQAYTACTYPLVVPPIPNRILSISMISQNLFCKTSGQNYDDSGANQKWDSMIIFTEPQLVNISLQDYKLHLIKLPDENQSQFFMSGVRLSNSEFLTLGGIYTQMNVISDKCTFFRIDQKGNLVVQPLKQMINKRYAFSCVRIGNYIIVAGGRQSGGDDQAVIPFAEKLDFSKAPDQKWEKIARMNIPRCSAIHFEHHGRFYVGGGYAGNLNREISIEVYDIHKDCWEMLGLELPQQIEASFVYKRSNNKNNIDLILFGGRTPQGDTDIIQNVQIDLNQSLDEQEENSKQLGKIQSKSCLIKGCVIGYDTCILMCNKNQQLVVEEYNLADILMRPNPRNNQLISQVQKHLNKLNVNGDLISKLLVL